MPRSRRWARWRSALLAAAVLGGCAGARADAGDADACLKAREGAAQTIAHCTAAAEEAGLPGPRRATLITQRGLARMSAGDLERARNDFDAAIALDGQSPWAFNARAVASMQAGDVDHAIADYEHSVQLGPGYAFAWANLGGARLIKGDTARALEALDEAIRLAPPHVELAFTGRGKVRLAMGQCDRALEDFNAALQANPRYANALSGRAYAHFCQGDFDGAAADFRAEREIRKDAESAVDLIIAVRRGGHDGAAELAALAGQGEARQGMAPGLALFSGTITPEQALQASADRDPKLQRQRRCAVHFEVGEWYLIRADRPRAREHLAQARETCDPAQRQFAAAGAELARLPAP